MSEQAKKPGQIREEQRAQAGTLLGAMYHGNIRHGGIVGHLNDHERPVEQRGTWADRLAGRPSTPTTTTPADPDDALLGEVGGRLAADDLAAIKADPEVKRRFCKAIRRERGWNEERAKKRAEAEAVAAETAKNQERGRLVKLGAELARAERQA